MINYPRAWKPRICLKTCCMILTAALTSSCSARQIPANSYFECVGRLQIGFPGLVDVASMTAKQFVEDGGASVFEFNDGQRAYFSQFVYGGSLAVTAPVDKLQSEAISKELKDRLSGVKLSVAKGLFRSPDGSPTTIDTFDLANRGSGWKISHGSNVSFVAYPVVPGHALSWAVSIHPQRSQEFKGYLEKFVAGVRGRPLYSVPVDRGVCFPHLFVQDGGDDAAGRLVAASYRLQQHPDVLIVLSDSSATDVDPNRSSRMSAAIFDSNLFWNQNYPREKSKDSLLNGSYNKVKLAGQDAVETMFRLVHDDGAEDYGYLVVARGDPGAGVDTPNVKLHLMRNAENATKRGIAPISKEAFFALAKSIAVGVTHRDTK